METTWTNFKILLTTYSCNFFYVDLGTIYIIKLVHGPIEAHCEIVKSTPESTDQTDFETNYKAQGNAHPVASFSPAFSAKTFEDKDLYKRITGIQENLTIGANTITFTIAYPWVKITGIEIINGSALDFVSMEVLDSTTGQYSGTPNKILNQFGFTVNISENYYKYDSEYDADLYEGMQIQLTYTSTSAKTIGINFLINEVS